MQHLSAAWLERPALTGLRALAVLPVLLLHAGFAALGGGYAGVDIFFVLSGFLMGGLLLHELQTGRFCLLGFYERRLRRILPALLLVLLVCLAVGWCAMLPQELRRFGHSLAATLLLGSNIYFWQNTHYFSPQAGQLPLLHTWSLAVEEQFYLLLPVLLPVLLLRLGQARLAALLLLLAVASLALAQWGALHAPVANFFLLPTRAWELLAGMLLALWEPRLRVVLQAHVLLPQLAAATGLGLVLLAVLAYDAATPYPGAYTVLPVLGALLLILCAQPAARPPGAQADHPVALPWAIRLLAAAPLVGIGRVSYSAYLWHQPLRVFAGYTALDLGSTPVRLALVLGALLLAALSWRWVEQPVRQRRWLQSRRALFGSCALAVALLCAAALALERGQGYPQRGHVPQPGQQQFASVDSGWCFYSVDTQAGLRVGRQGTVCHLGSPQAAVHGLLLGDSFAGHYEPFWDYLGRQAGWRLHVLTTNWCYPALGQGFPGPRDSRALAQCLFNRRYVAQHLAEYDFVVLAADWRNLLEHGLWEDASAFIRLAASQGRPVVLMPTPKMFDAAAFLRLQRASFFAGHASPASAPDSTGTSALARAYSAPQARDVLVQQANHRLQALAQQWPQLCFLPRATVFQVAGHPAEDLSVDGLSYSLDGSHISVYGALAAARQFVDTPAFAALRARLGPHHRGVADNPRAQGVAAAMGRAQTGAP